MNGWENIEIWEGNLWDTDGNSLRREEGSPHIYVPQHDGTDLHRRHITHKTDINHLPASVIACDHGGVLPHIYVMRE